MRPQTDHFPEDTALSRVIWTVGHSNRPAADFLALLLAQSITALADVRRFPGSRRWPQFGRDALAASLAEHGIEYHWIGELGGRRSRPRDAPSENTAWRVEAFNAYADHMQSLEFQVGLRKLETLAARRRTVLMCSEALPWRCHRRLIADLLVVRGWKVLDILGRDQVREHKLPDFAAIKEGILTYPGQTLF